MIARMWHGMVPAGKADEYLHLMRSIAIPNYQAVAGNRGAYVMRRIEGDVAHFEMLTFWDSLDAIRRFAGADAEISKYYDFDKDFLLEFEPKARHFELFDR